MYKILKISAHPEIITENKNYSDNFYFGLMKCRLITPINLYLPVIPTRINGKLMFPLCYKCASESNTENTENKCLTGKHCY